MSFMISCPALALNGFLRVAMKRHAKPPREACEAFVRVASFVRHLDPSLTKA
jgi:hypothetical protein